MAWLSTAFVLTCFVARLVVVGTNTVSFIATVSLISPHLSLLNTLQQAEPPPI